MGLLTSHPGSWGEGKSFFKNAGGTRHKKVPPIFIDDNGLSAKAYRVGHHETFLSNREEKIVDKTFSENLWTSKSMRNLIQYP
jgi:hypothetical protein